MSNCSCGSEKPLQKFYLSNPSGVITEIWAHDPPYRERWWDTHPVIFLGRSYNLWRQNFIKSVKWGLNDRKNRKKAAA